MEQQHSPRCCHSVPWGTGWQQVPGGPKNTGLGGPPALPFPALPRVGSGQPIPMGGPGDVGSHWVQCSLQEPLQAWVGNGGGEVGTTRLRPSPRAPSSWEGKNPWKSWHSLTQMLGEAKSSRRGRNTGSCTGTSLWHLHPR